MINQKYTRVFDTENRPLETAAAVVDEGIAMVFVKEGNRTVVTQSKGVADEIFAGISLARNTPPSFVPFVYEGVVDNETGLELPRLPMAGQILVRIDGDAATVGADAPSAAGSVQLEDQKLNFHADDSGKELFVQFMYEPTVNEARQFKGDVAVGGLASAAQGIIGLITRGDVSTSYFSAADDWSSALQVKLGADGKFTTGGPGVTLPNVTVLEAPSGENPMLTLRLG